MLLWALVSALIAYIFFPTNAPLYAIGTTLVLAAGFKLTELLVGVFTGVAKANPTAVMLIFCAKLGWWVLLFTLARHIEHRFSLPIALGIGAFLLAIITAGIGRNHLPKFSFVDKADS